MLSFCNSGLNPEVASAILSLFAQFTFNEDASSADFIPSPVIWDEIVVGYLDKGQLIPVAFYATGRQYNNTVEKNCAELQAIVCPDGQEPIRGEWIPINDAEGADYDLAGVFGNWVFFLNNSDQSINTIRDTAMRMMDGNMLAVEAYIDAIKSFLHALPGMWQLSFNETELILEPPHEV